MMTIQSAALKITQMFFDAIFDYNNLGTFK